MSNIGKILVVLGLCGMSFTVAGCGQSEPDVPDTAAEKIKAIEANPGLSDEDKARYKQQVAETERDRAMAQKMAPPPPPVKP